MPIRVRCYENRDVRWIEVSGGAAAAPGAAVRTEVAAAIAGADVHAARYVVDLSQLAAVGLPTVTAILGALPSSREVAVVPPPERGWLETVGRAIERPVTFFGSVVQALAGLGIDGRGVPRKERQENRRYVRVDTAIETRVWLKLPDGGRRGRATISNLSRGGAYLTALDWTLGPADVRAFLAGAGEVTLSIPLDHDKAHVRARIVRLETGRGVPHLGVQFEDVEPATGAALARYVAARDGFERAAI
jgi:hypothetical protein